MALHHHMSIQFSNRVSYLVHRLNNYGLSAITVGMQTPISVSAAVDLATNYT